jgi:hypothetical protein
MGFKPCRSDPGLFIRKEGGGHRVYVLTYVDDLLIISPQEEKMVGVKGRLKDVFKIHDLGDVSSFLGTEVKRDPVTGKLFMSNAQKIG